MWRGPRLCLASYWPAQIFDGRLKKKSACKLNVKHFFFWFLKALLPPPTSELQLNAGWLYTLHLHRQTVEPSYGLCNLLLKSEIGARFPPDYAWWMGAPTFNSPIIKGLRKHIPSPTLRFLLRQKSALTANTCRPKSAESLWSVHVQFEMLN